MSDKRIEKTVQLIEDSFFDLYQTIPLEKISITKICRQANINRSTFYYHYVDYPAFLAHLEKTIVNEYLAIQNQYNYDTDTEKIVSDTLSYLIEHKEKSQFLFREGSNGTGPNLIKSFLREKSMPIWLKESTISQSEFHLIFTYFINGTFSLLEYYFNHPNLDKDTVLNTMDQVIKYGVYNFIYTI